MRTKPKPGVATAQRKQRVAAKERSLGRCEAETIVGEKTSGKRIWARCRANGEVCAHIYQRRTCGPARDLPEVVLFTCREHNADHLHDARHGVRAPLNLAQKAYDTILAAKPKETALLGERPEKGIVPYD